ncbi:MAG: head-tail connector protein, partial [Rickettsiaceae bacterium]|nr:head-tail connector protein [Rickettsiaceae bacterium]
MKIISFRDLEENIIPLEDAKRYLRVSERYDDALIEELIKSAISYGESFIKLNISKKKIIFSVKLLNQKIYFPFLPIYSL